jgi:hypothetical protein
MNMQTIQIMILLLDGFIKIAPWQSVTETRGRTGYAPGKNLARSLRLAITVFAGL